MQTEKRPFFGKYEVLDQVGEGGFGRVVRARHRILGRDFAVKQLAPGLITNEADYARFTREAHAMAQLDHPHIVRVYDADVESGFPYIAMEFVEGPNVENLVAAEGPLPLDEVARLAREMASALAHMHEHGIIHRDVKSSNILRRATDGAYFLTDFGLAMQEGLARITTELTGSREFMSPEQTTGLPVPQSDQYGLGVVLFEALTGRKPFALENTHEQGLMHLLQRILHEPAPPVRAFRAGVPVWLADLVARCLEKRPEERYLDMRALEDVVLRGTAGSSGEPPAELAAPPVAAPPVSASQPESSRAVPALAAPLLLGAEVPRETAPPPAVPPAGRAPVSGPVGAGHGAPERPASPQRRSLPPIVWGMMVLGLAALAYVFTTNRGDGEEPRAYEPMGQTEETARNGPSETGGDPADEPRGAEPETAQEDVSDAPPPLEETRSGTEDLPAERATEPLPEVNAPQPQESEVEEREDLRLASDLDLSPEEARAVVDAYLQAGGSASGGSVERMYADRVRYYGRGTLSRSAVMRDKSYYLRQWPNRSYERTSDVSINESADGVKVRFDHTFEVEGESRGMRGEAWTELTFRREGDALRIVGENGGVRRRQSF